MSSLTVIIPCYNEAKTIRNLIDRLGRVNFGDRPVQIIVVDDGSTDNSAQLVPEYTGPYQITLIRHFKNRGKGSAVRSGLVIAQGEYTIIQDADLEYNPEEIVKLLNYAEKGGLIAVYGSRNLQNNRPASSIFYLGGWVMTLAGNLIYGMNLTDQCTCYKLVKTDILKGLQLYSCGFQLDTEITIKLARLNYGIKEIPISYEPRSIKEGKKINFIDAIKIFLTILRNRFWLPQGQHFNYLDKIIRYYRVRAAAKLIMAGGKILDLGCGTACYLSGYLDNHKIPHSYIGLDRRGPENIIASHLLKIYNVDGNKDLPVPDESQEYVTLIALIEHINNPHFLLKEAYRVLVRGGKLILTTPAPNSQKLLEIMAKLGLINKEEIEEHKHYFTIEEIKELLGAVNFKTNNIKIKKFEFGLNTLVLAVKD